MGNFYNTDALSSTIEDSKALDFTAQDLQLLHYILNLVGTQIILLAGQLLLEYGNLVEQNQVFFRLSKTLVVTTCLRQTCTLSRSLDLSIWRCMLVLELFFSVLYHLLDLGLLLELFELMVQLVEVLLGLLLKLFFPLFVVAKHCFTHLGGIALVRVV